MSNILNAVTGNVQIPALQQIDIPALANQTRDIQAQNMQNLAQIRPDLFAAIQAGDKNALAQAQLLQNVIPGQQQLLAGAMADYAKGGQLGQQEFNQGVRTSRNQGALSGTAGSTAGAINAALAQAGNAEARKQSRFGNLLAATTPMASQGAMNQNMISQQLQNFGMSPSDVTTASVGNTNMLNTYNQQAAALRNQASQQAMSNIGGLLNTGLQMGSMFGAFGGAGA